MQCNKRTPPKGCWSELFVVRQKMTVKLGLISPLAGRVVEVAIVDGGSARSVAALLLALLRVLPSTGGTSYRTFAYFPWAVFWSRHLVYLSHLAILYHYRRVKSAW